MTTTRETPVTGAARRTFHKSGEYHERARQLIAGGVNSNVRLGADPLLCFSQAKGSVLVDLDGNEYIDYALGMGPAVLGHAPPFLMEAVQASLSRGQLFAGQHEMELELAGLLHECVASAELVRIGLSGSEMIQTALRVARAHTGRSAFVKFEGHYHGWLDNVLINLSPPPSASREAVPYPVHLHSAGQSALAASEAYVLPWNDLELLQRFLETHGTNVAAILTEPVMCNTGVIGPRGGYLEGVRELCDRYGVVLIIDEVITGFRLALGGAQEKFGIRPDLSVFAKAMGGGFPIAALTGRADLMRLVDLGRVNHSGTYNANLVGVAAAIATLRHLMAGDGSALKAMALTGRRLIDGIRRVAAGKGVNLRVMGYGPVFNTMFGDDASIVDYRSYTRTEVAKQKAFVKALTLRGVRPTPRGTWFVSTAHSDADIQQTVAAVEQALSDIAS